MLRTYGTLLAAAALWTAAASANEAGFEEDFALAEDRAVALKKLIPGTEDYYYYHCLHYQNTRQKAAFEDLLGMCIKRYGHTRRVERLRNRQALLEYDADPARTMAYLKQKLELTFPHQKEVLGRTPNLPTRLDPQLIGRERLAKLAFGRYSNLQGFNDSALEFLARQELHPDLRRDLLSRLSHPDIPGLAKLVAEDLRHPHSGGFGSLGIHARMLRAQLDEVLALRPELNSNTAFVNAYLARLRPNAETDWEHDPAARREYLTELETFAAKLPPAFNSVKAHVLFQRLAFDRTQGVYEKERFLAYLKLPRDVHYVDPQYLNRRDLRDYRAELSADFRAVTALPPVGTDEELVRDYLMHFFAAEADYKPYAEFIRDDYLKRLFAETKIVHGLGDMEQWYSLLGDPAAYQKLKDRVDIDFAPTHPVRYLADDPVKLDLYVKNVEKLIVKVFEINTYNYYRDKGTEVGADLNLDGLVAGEEITHEYRDHPLRRVKRTFEFPKLSGPGMYVVEFIGSGRSSRALIRKGRIHFLERLTASGHEFMLLDEARRHLKEATLWLEGQQFEADKDGRIHVPYSTAPGRKNIVLRGGNLCTLERFEHRAETFRLSAGFFVDREALLAGHAAKVLIRPMLYVCGMPAGLKALEDVSLTISSQDREGIESSREIRDLKLSVGEETVQEFQVPKDVCSVRFTLKAKVKNLSANRMEDLEDHVSFSLNRIDTLAQIQDLHLSRVSDGYVLYVLGLNGEPLPDRPVHLVLQHRDFRDPVTADLKSDPQGRVDLGALEAIVRVTATQPGTQGKTWHTSQDLHTQPRTINGKAGETLRVPYMGAADPARPLDPAAFALLELRDGVFVKDHFGSLGLKEGFLELRTLPEGDYELRLKESGEKISVHLSAGTRINGHWVSGRRILEALQTRPLQIENVEVGAEDLVIHLRNHGERSRVHVTATKYVPGYGVFELFDRLAIPSPALEVLPKAISEYHSGRDIGDEYRYILERRYAKKFPGNMLGRPGLLLNPWAMHETASIGIGGGGSGSFGHRGTGGRRRMVHSGGGGTANEIDSGILPNLDYLAVPAPLFSNLKPDKDGIVKVPLKDFGDKTHLHIVALDPLATAYRQVALKESPTRRADLRLNATLDPEKRFTEQKRITPLLTGAALTVSDVSTSEIEIYDTLEKAWNLFATLSGNPNLDEFRFLLQWPKLKKEEKQAYYSKYACHELHFFLFKKDPEFFKTVVKPYLTNKHDQTFLDRWLLEEDLGAFLEPRAFSRLNIVERILLGQRLEDRRASVTRHVEDLFHLLPPDAERFNRLFRTSIRGLALEVRDTPLGGTGRAGRVTSEEQDNVAEEPKPEAAAARAPGKEEAGPGDQKDPGSKTDLDETVWEHEEKKAPRSASRRLYTDLKPTQEWAENNYYRLPIAQQEADLVKVNAFWEAYAKHTGAGPFLSGHFPEATRNFSEIMFALAVLDLPWEAGKHETASEGTKRTFTAASPAIVIHKEILPGGDPDAKSPLLVSQNLYALADRYVFEKNERREKYVTGEFLIHTVYGCQVVLTNPSSTPLKIDALLQIPRGAIPVQNGFYTRGQHVELGAYATLTLEYHFYFPAAGTYPHFPVHVARDGALLAAAPPFAFEVVEKPAQVDAEAWDYISQHGTEERVLGFLNANNIHRLDLDKIAWRMRDKNFFDKTLALLRGRHVYRHTLWSYGLFHGDLASSREFLRFAGPFLDECGPCLESTLVRIDPVERKTYEHLGYAPLLNERAHRFGPRPKIEDRSIFEQYIRLLDMLCHRPTLDNRDRLAVAYYLLLQDRIEEGVHFFAQVDVQKLSARLQHAYMSAYLDFYADAPKAARQIAERHKDHPVDRWRNAFRNVLNQLDEAAGKDLKVADEEDREQTQARLAAQAASFDFSVEDKKITIHYQNLKQCQVHYYLMDLELLFSHNPFVQQTGGQFAYVKPNHSGVLDLPDRKSHTFELPREFHNANVMIEISGGGVRKSQACYAHSLRVQVIENYGQVRVTDRETGKPLPKVYIKVYGQTGQTETAFIKDGYTDLRGRFDYSSVSTRGVGGVERFALLLMSEDRGAVIRETAPPAR